MQSVNLHFLTDSVVKARGVLILWKTEIVLFFIAENRKVVHISVEFRQKSKRNGNTNFRGSENENI